MTEEQEAKFDAWLDAPHSSSEIRAIMALSDVERARMTWQACLDANKLGSIPDGYYKIGEKVEVANVAGSWKPGVVEARVPGHSYCTCTASKVRRISP